MTTTSRIQASLLCLAIGDALGAPVEGMKQGHIQQVYDGDVTDYVDSSLAQPERPSRWRLKGLHTDDTQQALCIAEVLAIYTEADPAALADLYIRLAQEGPAEARFGSHRGTGRRFRHAVEAMKDVDDPMACGQPSAGNGAAMRVAPVGLYYHGDDLAVEDAAIRLSLLTHHDPRGIGAALAIAHAVGMLVEGQEPAEVAKALPDLVRRGEEKLVEAYGDYLEEEIGIDRLHYFSNALKPLAALVREANDSLARSSIINEANNCDPHGKVAQAQIGFAPASAVMSLYIALSASSLRIGIETAINGGGDTDTVGAMVGALLGARFGLDAVPEEWLDGLLARDFVLTRAQALANKEVDWAVWEDLIESERAFTENELHMIRKAMVENEKAIAKHKQEQQTKRQRAASKKAEQEYNEQTFAPLADEWLNENEIDRARLDPVQAKKERALRGKKRIEWKEDLRRQKRRSKQSKWGEEEE